MCKALYIALNSSSKVTRAGAHRGLNFGTFVYADFCDSKNGVRMGGLIWVPLFIDMSIKIGLSKRDPFRAQFYHVSEEASPEAPQKGTISGRPAGLSVAGQTRPGQPPPPPPVNASNVCLVLIKS